MTARNTLGLPDQLAIIDMLRSEGAEIIDKGISAADFAAYAAKRIGRKVTAPNVKNCADAIGFDGFGKNPRPAGDERIAELESKVEESSARLEGAHNRIIALYQRVQDLSDAVARLERRADMEPMPAIETNGAAAGRLVGGTAPVKGGR